MKVPFLKLIVRKIRKSIAIVEEGDTVTHSGGLAVGKYVIWKGTQYNVTTAMSYGETISGSKLSAVSDGIANELNSNVNNYTLSDGALKKYTNTSLNSITASGRYGISSTCSDKPTMTGGVLDVYKYDSDTIRQAYRPDNSTRVFERVYIAPSWSSWEELALNGNMKPKNDFAIVEGYVQAGGGNTIVPYPTGYSQYTCCVIATYSDLFGTRYNNEATCYSTLESNGVNLHLPGGGSGLALVRAALMKTGI